ncbi:homoserine O- acetyltransferase [Blastocladiella emersonii ATCC 22665]|nr:homoserine O- acetyltransferase [Blastocladiella emersonii ATCC 22665]
MPSSTSTASPDPNAAAAAPARPDPHATNPYLKLVADQHIAHIPSFTLECGATLTDVPVAYKTWGTLNAAGTNVLVICHALSGSADVADWWAPLLGPGRAFDTRRFFVVCCNVLGSPYGSASPLSVNPATGRIYGPGFPVASIRDDVRIHRRVLDSLGVRQVAFAIGGSMGGAQVLEWGAEFGPDYVRFLVPMATSSRHSAWCISWGEAQRQAIFADPNYLDGHYPVANGPVTGLASARMQAMLTYRSRNSFESRFGRKVMTRAGSGTATVAAQEQQQVPPPVKAVAGSDEAAAAPLRLAHNDGLEHYRSNSSSNLLATATASAAAAAQTPPPPAAPVAPESKVTPGVFSAQSYLRYQGDKFVRRFDANCYISLTRKLDTHDVSRGRTAGVPATTEAEDELQHWTAVAHAVRQPTLVLGVESDGLFTLGEQEQLAARLPNARLEVIQSPDGHDGFLLEFDQVGRHVAAFMREVAPELFAADGAAKDGEEVALGETAFTSTFGEADLIAW